MFVRYVAKNEATAAGMCTSLRVRVRVLQYGYTQCARDGGHPVRLYSCASLAPDMMVALLQL